MIDLGYLIVCPLAYLLAGMTKFAVNTARGRQLAFHQIGLGGFPSTHTSVASAPAWIIFLREGPSTPALAVAIGFLMIVAIDAMDLRSRLGRVNRLLKARFPDDPEVQRLRDRMGHSPLEVLSGIIVGALASFIVMLAWS